MLNHPPRETLAALLGLLLIITLPLAAAPSADSEALIGSWDLVSLENRAADGSVERPFGAAPVGRLTYTADGFMSAQIMNGDRPPFATPDLYSGTPVEKAAAYESYIAYYGAYAVDAIAHTVTHRVKGSLFPNWTGGQQVRYYTVEGNKLILTTKPFKAQGKDVTAHVVWQRATN